MKTKYPVTLALFQKELLENEEQARNQIKDYPHRPEEITKEILMMELKAVHVTVG